MPGNRYLYNIFIAADHGDDWLHRNTTDGPIIDLGLASKRIWDSTWIPCEALSMYQQLFEMICNGFRLLSRT